MGSFSKNTLLLSSFLALKDLACAASLPPVEVAGNKDQVCEISGEIAEKTKRATVVIALSSLEGKKYDSLCTGFFISPNRVATAGHCFEHTRVARTLTYFSNEKNTFVTIPLDLEDYAINLANTHFTDAAFLEFNSPLVSEEVPLETTYELSSDNNYYIFNIDPSQYDQNASITFGALCGQFTGSTTNCEGGTYCNEFNLTGTRPGNSGSALVNEDGKAVGILSSRQEWGGWLDLGRIKAAKLP